MRKNINKLVAFAIGISVMSGTSISALAADTTTTNTSTTAAASTSTSVAANTTVQIGSNIIDAQNQVKLKPVLKLDDAIDSAIRNSEKLALQSKQIKLYEDKMDIQEKFNDISDSDNDFPYDKLEVLAKQAKEQKEYTKDQIAQDITTKYNSIVDKEKALDKLKKQIQIKTKQINDTNLKKNLGLVTAIDVKNAEIELDKIKNSQKLKENQLKNSQDFFQVLTGKYVSQYSLEDTQPFEAFRITGDVDAYFDGVIDKYKKYDKKLLELTKDNLKDNKVDKPDGDAPKKSDYEDSLNDDGSVKISAGDKYNNAVAGYKKEWSDYGSYLEQKFGYSTDVYTLNETKKGLKNGLKDSYANLLDMENSIKVMQTNIAVKNKELANSKLKYDMGLMTKTDYNSLVLDNDELENSLRTAVNNYNTLKNQIQKPWISAGGATSAN